MAGLNLVGNPGAVALSAGVAKTVLMVKAPANQRLRLFEWAVGYDGIVTTNTPVTVELVRYTADGTMSALTPRKEDSGLAETPQSVWTHTATAEPTVDHVMDSITVHPQTAHVNPFAYAREWMVPGGTRFGIRCTAVQVVNVRPRMRIEE